jgi:hypothetical protein
MRVAVTTTVSNAAALSERAVQGTLMSAANTAMLHSDAGLFRLEM